MIFCSIGWTAACSNLTVTMKSKHTIIKWLLLKNFNQMTFSSPSKQRLFSSWCGLTAHWHSDLRPSTGTLHFLRHNPFPRTRSSPALHLFWFQKSFDHHSISQLYFLQCESDLRQWSPSGGEVRGTDLWPIESHEPYRPETSWIVGNPTGFSREIIHKLQSTCGSEPQTSVCFSLWDLKKQLVLYLEMIRSLPVIQVNVFKRATLT